MIWHRLVCIPLNRNAIRETVDGVLGFRCGCGLWRPVMERHESERLNSPRPAHETYRVNRVRVRWFRIIGRKDAA